MESDIRHRRLAFRSWHRGTREADYMIGGFFDRYGKDFTAEELDWFESLLEQDDVDIMAWAIGREEPPMEFSGPLMEKMRVLDYIEIPR